MDFDPRDIGEKLERPIVLVGMMGSGKSLIGKILAQALALEYFDSDKIIEDKAGCSISEIFARDGEEKFRQAEQNTLAELLEKKAAVISTGGGAVTRSATLAAIKAKAFSVWLSADASVLFERLKSKTDRPLLQDDDPLGVIQSLLDKRASLYGEADIKVEVAEKTPAYIRDEIIKRLYEQHVPASV